MSDTPESPNAGRWQYVLTDELLALHKVALHAREAVQIAADAGVHLGPLRAALDETAYKVSPFPPADTAERQGRPAAVETDD